ncbi:sodium channel and clathrin linker 1 isoform X3 [Numida meleagris]|uniref:sodium channel and clathrin linker 1 isoform X3 n=1 Tax=Numida meleagris TaxID=8996 RepID=UPI000B3DFC75|nr:sodium channel and clathrin linker 1 isoform X3 [Numida meleagris]
MAAELRSGGEPDQKLNVAFEQGEADEILSSAAEKNVAGGDGISRSTMTDQSLITKNVEHEKCMDEMREQLQIYQVQMNEMRQKFEQVTAENRRLHAELKESLEMQLDALPFMPLGTVIPADEEILRNLQEQLQLTNQEKEQAIELWQTVSQELDQLQQQYQQHMTQTQIHMAERLKQQDQLANFHQLTTQLHAANEKTELEEDVVSAQQREAASDKLLQQMQSSIKQLETRLHVTVQDAEQLRTERADLEKQIRTLQTKCANLEREKYEAVAKVQDCIQLLEEANLQKSQALFKKKQKEEEIKKMKDEIFQLAEDTAARIRKEVDSAKKQYNVQISQLTEELLALHMECGEKQGQIERAIREKRAVEEELEKICREYGGHESDNRKLEQLHQKYLFAETTKCDLQLSLQTTQHKLKLLEMNFEEEKSNYQKNICNLQSILDSEREKSGFIGEQRLKLQQENEQLQKEIESLKKLATEAQQKAKIKISTMEHEHAVKEHGYEVRLKEMEDISQKSTAELRHLLAAQQKATNRWKEETKVLTETTEARINKLKSDLSQQKLRNQELIAQLETANDKVIEDEKLMTEYQKHINRLQTRLSQAEQRAATASQKLSTLTTWKKKATSAKELENI